ncbi:UDP-N-acetylmuramoyl-L-alanine--D-glutamate ligase [Salinisphaera sp. Q1T1-3]|uniref:UDP-N-acetylmuramoyl-L-alanine--D-glutamate ligase n=1 Tax=Salinisphaera sp. Q1T1-3 TaxID=2321229 RepID=UPI000E742E32|nr:UDP-N-acetylmuramoyl-L-alanine--D-glutamate ligase [Salinisphaera sp. Q1T1-3]RJS92226.1 UDP-N-acetylmuramoyl-L-alanine--D-glutamate ligase [Salinisphaera sp. Q1T1-3]
MSAWARQLADRHVLVVGCGATGASAARFAAERGARVRIVDSRETPPAAEMLADAFPSIEIRTGGLDPHALTGIDELVVSPGVDLREPLIEAARAAGHAIVGDIEWFARVVDAPVVAITGSNGKSTVSAWLHAAAEAAGIRAVIGGNFGTPALSLLSDTVALYVLELSSFQLALCETLAPVAATVLNISPDHIDRHGDLADYIAAKARIFDRATIAVLNADDPEVAAMAADSPRVVRFGAGHDVDYRLTDDGDLARGDDVWLRGDALSLSGRHNAMNALAVWALADVLAIEWRAIAETLTGFAGLAHRCQPVATVDDVVYVDDSKGTNMGAMLASLAGMDRPVVLLAGGQAKGQDFAPLGPVAGARARAVIVFGQDAEAVARGVGTHAPVTRVADLAEAVRKAHALARAGDVVLLSPGCASFDQFSGYVARGQAFAAAVSELAA